MQVDHIWFTCLHTYTCGYSDISIQHNTLAQRYAIIIIRVPQNVTTMYTCQLATQHWKSSYNDNTTIIMVLFYSYSVQYIYSRIMACGPRSLISCRAWRQSIYLSNTCKCKGPCLVIPEPLDTVCMASTKGWYSNHQCKSPKTCQSDIMPHTIQMYGVIDHCC